MPDHELHTFFSRRLSHLRDAHTNLAERVTRLEGMAPTRRNRKTLRARMAGILRIVEPVKTLFSIISTLPTLWAILTMAAALLFKILPKAFGWL